MKAPLYPVCLALLTLLVLPSQAVFCQIEAKITYKQARTLGPKFALSRFGETFTHLVGLNDDEPYALAPDYTFWEREVDTSVWITEGMKARFKVWHRDSSLALDRVYHVWRQGDTAVEIHCDGRKRIYEPFMRNEYDSASMVQRRNTLQERLPDGSLRISTIQQDANGKRFIWRPLQRELVMLQAAQIDQIRIVNLSKLFRSKGGKFLYDFAWGTAGMLTQLGVLVGALVLVSGG
jgi:hypothetical protein